MRGWGLDLNEDEYVAYPTNFDVGYWRKGG